MDLTIQAVPIFRLGFYDQPVSNAQVFAVMRRAHSKTWLAGLASFALMASAQIALPLSPDTSAGLTTFTVVTFAISTLFFAALTRTYEEIGLTFLAVFAISLSVEAIGVATGWPFGRYEYGGALQPQLLGVPAIVPLAWFAIALPAREISRRILAGKHRYLQFLVGGLAIAAWDVFLDPQMTHEGYWVWQVDGPWQGVPISNYVGWGAIGVVLMVVIDSIERRKSKISPPLVLSYVWMAGIETLGFLLPFAFDRPVVGIVGGLLMGPFALLALKRSPRPWLG